jgi:hypothetical protein
MPLGYNNQQKRWGVDIADSGVQVENSVTRNF